MRISDWSSDVCSSDLAMLASIVVAYIVTPWAANRWVKRPAPTGGILDDGSEAESEANTHEERKPDKLRDVYLWLIKPLQESSSVRRALMIGAILALLLSEVQGGWKLIRTSGVGRKVRPVGVAIGFLPTDNKNTLTFDITMVEAS